MLCYYTGFIRVMKLRCCEVCVVSKDSGIKGREDEIVNADFVLAQAVVGAGWLGALKAS